MTFGKTKYSGSFVEKIRNVKASKSLAASFDVKCIFTNIPLKQAIDEYTDQFYMFKKPSLSKETFVNLLKNANCDERFSF